MSIGVDIEDISRFEGKSDAFLNRIFTPLELEYCRKFSNPQSRLAARFCAKEATIKALSALGINFAEYNLIEIFHNENNVPQIRILKEINKSISFELSISHDKTKAIAFVTAKLN